MIKEKFLFLFNAIFYIAFWCFMMFKPNLALDTILIVFWIESIISWIAWVVFAVQDKESRDRWLLAVVAAAQILIWVLLVCFPEAWETILKAFVVLLWIWAIIEWILLMINSFRLKKMGERIRWWILVAWIFLALVWLFVACNSLLTILIINGVIWLWMALAGISMIIIALQVRKNAKIIEEQVEEAMENWEWVEIEITKVTRF